jgi:hypothetical protein
MLTVSEGGVAYLMYDDWEVYALDLGTFTCSATPYSGSALGFVGSVSLALGAERGADRLYVYGTSTASSLAVSDVSDFTPFVVGPISPGAPEVSVDLKADAYGRLLGLSADGRLSQLDPATGTVVAQDQLSLDPSSTWALLAYGTDVFVIGAESGVVERYDLTTQKLVRVYGLIEEPIVGASAPPCTVAAPAYVATPSGPPAFVAGDVWIGSYGCSQETVNVALVVDSADDTTLSARFDFNWVAGHTTGSYEVSGTFDANTREARFSAGDWVSQPSPNWSTVTLDGFVSLDGLKYSGGVWALGCGSFTLQK